MTLMTQHAGLKKTIVVASLLAAGSLLAGCVGSSTYGTGKTQEQQLVDDLTGIFSPKKSAKIAYTARPNIVQPKTTAALPAPVAGTAVANGSQWPETPEARLKRLREDLDSADPNARGDAKRELLLFDQSKRDAYSAGQQRRLAAIGIDPDKTELTPSEQRAFIERYRKNNPNDITRTNRRYLSEPPTLYRQPAETAAFGDLGLTEKQKRECLKAKGGNSGLFGAFRLRNKKKECANYLASLNLVDPKKKK